ncbi:cytochrome c [Blastopirellula sp. JC732]|uniref:Cytochrome c n=1 Tax=Blastopirellula sediminis TaxID=2894196 RepID=A0A9X1SIN1_9BACT|nr:cytochrome c [Blastopirellula sediminis]MCC9604902.1 cytochrome c [Blastopirellula sediminis]MCC9631798.1 cytochrome c [Blastopirellula sediminis]
MKLRLISLGLLLFLCGSSLSLAGDPEKGYHVIVDKPLISPYWDQETFDNTWRVWPKDLKELAEKASPEERKRMAYDRYGLTPRPDNPNKPLQYVVGDDGLWTPNCFTCHGGEVAGQVIPGAPNHRYAMQTLADDIRYAKMLMGKRLLKSDYGSAVVPLGGTNGTTNAVMFGVILMAFRDADLNVHSSADFMPTKHHDMDAPAWWNFAAKDYIYCDAFAPKGVKGLMQFALARENGPEKFRGWQEDFENVYAYLESIKAPKYPYEVDKSLAEQGRIAFEKTCARCHGKYGPEEKYPSIVVDIEELGTDPVRYEALSPADRKLYGDSWFNEYNQGAKTVDDPAGYVAPHLAGVWASPPYFHNGSVPTLWHVLNPSERPTVWHRTSGQLDQQRVGLTVKEFARMPPEVTRRDERRNYFDTRNYGKSAAGHDYPDELTPEEKRAVLEYLKTL